MYVCHSLVQIGAKFVYIYSLNKTFFDTLDNGEIIVSEQLKIIDMKYYKHFTNNVIRFFSNYSSGVCLLAYWVSSYWQLNHNICDILSVFSVFLFYFAEEYMVRQKNSSFCKVICRGTIRSIFMLVTMVKH